MKEKILSYKIYAVISNFYLKKKKITLLEDGSIYVSAAPAYEEGGIYREGNMGGNRGHIPVVVKHNYRNGNAEFPTKHFNSSYMYILMSSFTYITVLFFLLFLAFSHLTHYWLLVRSSVLRSTLN